MSFVYTRAISKLRKMTKRIRIVRGGTSAGKTYGIIPILINKAARNSGLEISIVSESIPHLRRGAMKDFLKIMQATGRFFESNWNKSLLTYRFASGSYIEFFSADQPDKLRGARRTHLYINECNNIDFESYQQLAIRTSKEIWLDYNPVEEFWVDTELMNDPDAELLVLTYKDNNALDPSIIREIEKARDKAATSDYWANWWRVYGLGEIGIVEGIIFPDWKQVDRIPDGAKLIAHGLDFGFTNDPTALVSVYMQNGELYVNERLYRTGMTNMDIGNFIKSIGINSNEPIIADSAEPKSIRELQLQGFNVQGANKGQDSVRASIDILKSYKINVTKDSVKLIKELRGYKWDKRDGKYTSEPVDFMNHAIDAMRYVALNKLGNRPTGKYRLINV